MAYKIILHEYPLNMVEHFGYRRFVAALQPLCKVVSRNTVKNSLKYPILQLVARDVLAIPISTVASESAFSTSGRFVSPHCSRLHHDTLEALMCSQDWLWAASKGGA
ncbi:hypothetical protein ACS0TY_003862 [Phlomoides rotata]